MIKFAMPMCRKPGMTTDAFREYYETHHRLLGEKYLKGFATKYVRRFLDPLPDRQGVLSDPEYDVILEIWYPDAETQKACSRHLSQPDIAKEIAEDEERLFDRTRMRGYIVVEHESDMQSDTQSA